MMKKNNDLQWDFSGPWQRVKWPYDKWFRAHISKRVRYEFVRNYWDKGIPDMISCERLKVEKTDPCPVRLSKQDKMVLKRISRAGVNRLMELLIQIQTLTEAKQFCKKANIKGEELIPLLRKVYKYLPFGAQMRQLVEKDDLKYQKYVDLLIKEKVGFSLALLDIGRTVSGRKQLSKTTGIPISALLDLVKRADFTRLRLQSGGMVRLSWALGYKGIKSLRKAQPEQWYNKCLIYFKKKYKDKPFDLTMNVAKAHVVRMEQAVDIIEE